MSAINHYIANSTGELDNLKDLISKVLSKVIPEAEKDLKANQIDIIFVSASRLAIPEYGLGGNSPGPHHIYISFDPKSDKISEQGLEETLYHEIHHCMRWRDPGFGSSLGEAIIFEGLACLYEEQKTGRRPLYAQVKLGEEHVRLAKSKLQSQDFDRSEWFFGSKKIDRWFGYGYGYRLCKEYSDKTGRTAADLVNVPTEQILASK